MPTKTWASLVDRKVAPEEAAYVGDLYLVDVVGAREAGLLPILYDPFDLSHDVDCLRIRTIDELLTSQKTLW